MPSDHTRASLFARSTSSPSRVLVVDDDDAVRRFVKRILDDEGYVVEDSATAPDALMRVRDGQAYDLVVADVCMPEMSGPQLVARMRQTGSQAKVLYVTGFADQLFDERSDKLWADEAFLDKPCTVQGLREAVSLLLHGQIDGSPAAKTAHRTGRGK
jgi:two-component system, cell cycle sensor histidine kinase and response regulator CckA